MALPYLPDDLIRTKIMKLLPVKSLVRFRSVCKSWNSFIFEPDFIKEHFNFITTQTPDDDSLVITRRVVEDSAEKFIDLAILDLSDLSETRLLHVPCNSEYTVSAIDMLGSINGLVCLFLNKLDQLIIWNPAVSRAMNIDSPARQLMLCQGHVTKSLLGFCWDAMENDYKVVISYFTDYQLRLTLFVYSCNLASWSSPINSAVFGGFSWLTNEAPSAVVNGVPYWTYTLGSVGNLRVIKFDFESKDFRALPTLYSGREDYYAIVVNLEECLCALAYKAQSDDNLVDVHRFDERDGFWSKMYNVGPITGKLYFNDTPLCDETVLGCFKYGGEIVFSGRGASPGHRTRCYNHKTKKVTDLHNQKGMIKKCFRYKASLIIFEGMKPQHEVEPTLWK